MSHNDKSDQGLVLYHQGFLSLLNDIAKLRLDKQSLREEKHYPPKQSLYPSRFTTVNNPELTYNQLEDLAIATSMAEALSIDETAATVATLALVAPQLAASPSKRQHHRAAVTPKEHRSSPQAKQLLQKQDLKNQLPPQPAPENAESTSEAYLARHLSLTTTTKPEVMATNASLVNDIDRAVHAGQVNSATSPSNESSASDASSSLITRQASDANSKSTVGGADSENTVGSSNSDISVGNATNAGLVSPRTYHDSTPIPAPELKAASAPASPALAQEHASPNHHSHPCAQSDASTSTQAYARPYRSPIVQSCGPAQVATAPETPVAEETSSLLAPAAAETQQAATSTLNLHRYVHGAAHLLHAVNGQAMSTTEATAAGIATGSAAGERAVTTAGIATYPAVGESAVTYAEDSALTTAESAPENYAPMVTSAVPATSTALAQQTLVATQQTLMAAQAVLIETKPTLIEDKPALRESLPSLYSSYGETLRHLTKGSKANLALVLPQWAGTISYARLHHDLHLAKCISATFDPYQLLVPRGPISGRIAFALDEINCLIQAREASSVTTLMLDPYAVLTALTSLWLCSIPIFMGELPSRAKIDQGLDLSLGGTRAPIAPNQSRTTPQMKPNLTQQEAAATPTATQAALAPVSENTPSPNHDTATAAITVIAPTSSHTKREDNPAATATTLVAMPPAAPQDSLQVVPQQLNLLQGLELLEETAAQKDNAELSTPALSRDQHATAAQQEAAISQVTTIQQTAVLQQAAAIQQTAAIPPTTETTPAPTHTSSRSNALADSTARGNIPTDTVSSSNVSTDTVSSANVTADTTSSRDNPTDMVFPDAVSGEPGSSGNIPSDVTYSAAIPAETAPAEAAPAAPTEAVPAEDVQAIQAASAALGHIEHPKTQASPLSLEESTATSTEEDLSDITPKEVRDLLAVESTTPDLAFYFATLGEQGTKSTLAGRCYQELPLAVIATTASLATLASLDKLIPSELVTLSWQEQVKRTNTTTLSFGSHPDDLKDRDYPHTSQDRSHPDDLKDRAHPLGATHSHSFSALPDSTALISDQNKSAIRIKIHDSSSGLVKSNSDNTVKESSSHASTSTINNIALPPDADRGASPSNATSSDLRCHTQPGQSNNDSATSNQERSTPGVDSYTPSRNSSAPGVDSYTPSRDNRAPGIDNYTNSGNSSVTGRDSSILSSNGSVTSDDSAISVSTLTSTTSIKPSSNPLTPYLMEGPLMNTEIVAASEATATLATKMAPTVTPIEATVTPIESTVTPIEDTVSPIETIEAMATPAATLGTLEATATLGTLEVKDERALESLASPSKLPPGGLAAPAEITKENRVTKGDSGAVMPFTPESLATLEDPIPSATSTPGENTMAQGLALHQEMGQSITHGQEVLPISGIVQSQDDLLQPHHQSAALGQAAISDVGLEQVMEGTSAEPGIALAEAVLPRGAPAGGAASARGAKPAGVAALIDTVPMGLAPVGVAPATVAGPESIVAEVAETEAEVTGTEAAVTASASTTTTPAAPAEEAILQVQTLDQEERPGAKLEAEAYAAGFTMVQVALNRSLFATFDYKLAGIFDESIIGCRVKVSFGRAVARNDIGLVVDIGAQSNLSLGRIKEGELIDKEPLITPDVLAMLSYASRYYHYPVGQTIMLALPQLLRSGGAATYKEIPGLISNVKANDLEKVLATLRSGKQRELLLALQHGPRRKRELREEGFTPAQEKALQQKRLVKSYDFAAHSSKLYLRAGAPDHTFLAAPPLPLNQEQQYALTAISQHQGFGVFLLYGVTGSGKTEVYLQAIAETLRQGKTAMVLVPEIALTPQTFKRFYERFKVPIATSHSNLSPRERLDAFLDMSTERAGIIIGTRSALFTPCHNLGLIVIDEEHDSSFKQNEGLHYHTRTLAIYRAKLLGAKLILGSATPSLESFYQCQCGAFMRLDLFQRAKAARLPELTLIDLKEEHLDEGLEAGISSTLENMVGITTAAHQQALLFLNRRGFSHSMICHNCGRILTCPHCDNQMTVHRITRQLRCHICDTAVPIPTICPYCHAEHSLIEMGVGTEKVADYLSERFCDVGIERIDRDSMTSKNDLDEALTRVLQHKSEILIGTQMLAKGHDFPDVTLVGILDVDSGLFCDDFRGWEYTAQLVTQVAGRAGRSHKIGYVYIQTRFPDHQLLLRLISPSFRYIDLAYELLQLRQNMHMPPFTYQAVVMTNSTDRNRAFNTLREIFAEIEQQPMLLSGVSLSPIMPDKIEKRFSRFHFHVVLNAFTPTQLSTVLDEITRIYSSFKNLGDLRFAIDVDPIISY